MTSSNETQVHVRSFKSCRQLRHLPRSRRDQTCGTPTTTRRYQTLWRLYALLGAALALSSGCFPDEGFPDVKDSTGAGSQDSQQPEPSPEDKSSTTESSGKSGTPPGDKESGTSTTSSPDTNPEDSDSSTSTSDSGPTSTDTSTESPSEDGSNPSKVDPDDPRLRVVIKEDLELCARCQGYVTATARAFATKQRLHLQPGRFSLDEVVVAGEVFRGETPYSFESEPFEMRVWDETEALRARSQSATAVLPDGELLHILVTLYNDYDGNPYEFVLDDFSKMSADIDFKRFELTTEKVVPALNDSKYRAFGACRMENGRHDVFRFELEDESYVEFETYSKYFGYFGGRQAGQTIRAAGNLRGYKFEIEDIDDLIYCNPVLCNSLKIPDLAVRFPEQDGVCAISLRSNRIDETKDLYSAEILDCDLNVIDTIDIVNAEIPSGFGR